ncbi:MAG: tripartite tricarboxylate transporter TctB family protein [Paracoccus sp. (in: a-proteobacteria)]|uniref:tripartite tricarboxylate transporter TctB family protein n=1 Tax=Paracoccus sp. TaxID=267 RepID=UPI0026E022BA|nr:tripartite tricarboxylate transporter TctB family protein [Paracoccus sp. (in: a-proteobacteria)]MDO5620268.1 tripartite tricarboxylate transporter TctB family protein [Paracoccus sp. (in: a-proteobacteria)]
MQHHRNQRSAGELVFNALLFLASLFLLWTAYNISGFSSLSSPGTLPMALTFAMVVTSGMILRNTLQSPRDGSSFFTDILPARVVILTVLIAAYAVLVVPLGFLPTSLAFLFLSILYLRRGGVLSAFGLAVLSLAVVYVVFRLIFSVLLPAGIVPEGEILAAIRGLF